MKDYIKGTFKKIIFKSDQNYIIGLFKVSDTNTADLEEYIDHDLISYFYGNHVLSALQDAFDEGKVVENDTRAWY